MTATKLGVVQTRIMKVLWDSGKATARQITDELNRRFPTDPIAHSTVQTLLRGLMDKDAITHQTEGRTFVFEPKVAEDKVRKSATRDLLQQVFGGKASDLVSYLLTNEKVSKAELDQIKKLVSEKTKKK
jgi:BlaI family penicillinase repressor